MGVGEWNLLGLLQITDTEFQDGIHDEMAWCFVVERAERNQPVRKYSRVLALALALNQQKGLKSNDMRPNCRGGQIRTDDLLVPNQARYRATLHPEKNSRYLIQIPNCGRKTTHLKL
jgi:hypothetical protein